MGRSRWKAITLDWELLQGLDDTTIFGVCLTRRKAAILKALLTTAYWQTRWTNLGISNDELQAQMAELDYLLEGADCGMCNMEFRDNPNDLCEVQYSNDGGETWVTMFRKDVCVAAVSVNIENIQEGDENVTINNVIYDNDIINIAPDWEYNQTYPHDKWNDVAMCYAIKQYIDWQCELAISQIKSENEIRKDNNQFWNDALETLGIAIIAAVAAVSSVNPAAITAVGYAMLDMAHDLWIKYQDDDFEMFEDADARDAVACWMYNRVRGDTPQFDTWSSSLDTFEPDGDNETAIAESIDLVNKSEDVYVNYLFLLNDLNDIADALPECDCPPGEIIDQLVGETSTDYWGMEFCHSTSLAFSNPGDAQAVCPGVYNEGGDIYTGVASSIGGVGCNIRVVLPPDVLITQVKVRWAAYRQQETSHGDKNAGIWLGEPNNGGTYIGGYSWGVIQNQWQYMITTVSDEEGILATPETQLWIHNSIDRNNGHARIYWVHIETIPYEP